MYHSGRDRNLDDGKYDDPTRRTCKNQKLLGDEFAKANYCKNNFNDFISAFVTLFELTVVNQWHVITRGYVKVTNGGAFVYFILFHMIQVCRVGGEILLGELNRF